jgi:hypothetical protein
METQYRRFVYSQNRCRRKRKYDLEKSCLEKKTGKFPLNKGGLRGLYGLHVPGVYAIKKQENENNCH